MTSRYVGRFAPSPSGLLHAGSLVAALASWLDARANAGRWLVRIEDLDGPRNREGAAETILGQLESCGLVADATPLCQSARTAAYQEALDRLVAARRAYPCGCSRRDLELAAAPGHRRADRRQRRSRRPLVSAARVWFRSGSSERSGERRPSLSARNKVCRPV